jgi:hypothetical protein
VIDQVVAVRRRWISPRTTSTIITAAATNATMAAMPAIRPIVDQANVEQQAAEGLPAEQALPLPADLVSGGLQLGDSGLVRTRLLGLGHGGIGLPLRPTEFGVGGAVGDVGEVPVDEAGVSLGLGAGGDLFARVLDEVGAAVLLERRLVGEEDVLGGQLVADVVLGEVAAPGQQGAGDDEDAGDEDAGEDEQGVDGAPAQDDRVLDRAGGRGGGGSVRLGRGRLELGLGSVTGVSHVGGYGFDWLVRIGWFHSSRVRAAPVTGWASALWSVT